MREILSPSFSRLCYGYSKDSNQNIFVDEQQAGTVKFIFQEYLKGATTGKAIGRIAVTQYPFSVRERALVPCCHRQAYLQYQIRSIHLSPEQFLQVQDEKARRSNQALSEDGFQRKATRYHSQNVLSGLLFARNVAPAIEESPTARVRLYGVAQLLLKAGPPVAYRVKAYDSDGLESEYTT